MSDTVLVEMPVTLFNLIRAGGYSPMPWRAREPGLLVDAAEQQIWRAVAFDPNVGILSSNDQNCQIVAEMTRWLVGATAYSGDTAKAAQGDRLRELQRAVVEWANSIFPQRTQASAFMKLFEEVGELIRQPNSPGEYADILIMLLDLADMHGIDLLKAGFDKMDVNRKRSWVKGALGTLQHVED